MKKGYVHIREYDLTKLILDQLDVDIEDEYELVYSIVPLEYKNKKFILPEYKKFMEFEHVGVILRPFINQAHAQYLINLFCDAKECEATFQHAVGEDDKDKFDGILTVIEDRNKLKTEYKVKGIKNVPVLMSALMLKAMLSHDEYKKNRSNILKLDSKIEGK
jgi:hypothetical protein